MIYCEKTRQTPRILRWPHSLYWKIFLAYWIAVVLSVAAAAWMNRQSSDLYAGHARPGSHRERLLSTTQEAWSQLENGGLEQLQLWLERRPNLLVMAQQWGDELRGRPVHYRLAFRHLRGRYKNWPGDIREGILFPGVLVYQSAPYFLLLPPHPPPATLKNLLLSGVRIPLGLLISAVVCLWLAHYLTRPIRQLRTTATALANTRMEARVPDAIGLRKDEIGDLGRDFNRMAEKLELAMSSLKMMLSDLSHELRSPLARLQVAIALAEKECGGGQRQLTRISHEAGQIEALIAQVMVLVQMEHGHYPLEMEQVETGELLDQIAADARYEFQGQSGLSIKTDTARFLILSDPILLARAVENVVRNAARHAPQGTISISAQERGSDLKISVSDQGPGIDEQKLPRIFDPFFSADQSRSSSGFGLGLAIAARAIKLLGGEISATNLCPNGLRVVLSLPLHRVS